MPLGARQFARNAAILQAMPTIDQLSKDPFMKQVSYAAEIVPLLSTEEDEHLSELLKAQLSHSDGIRGFFVNYLTAKGETSADSTVVPPPLVSAMQTVQDRNDLISLASMNVIMPTAMSTMHTDDTLQASSARTAERGIRILKHLATLDPDGVKPVCTAILAATSDSKETTGDVEYWRKFFANYGYEERQKTDISAAIGAIVG